MLSPPRLPALCIAFHADAWFVQSRAMHGLNGEERCIIFHADPCTLCMHHSLQSGWPEKGLQKDKRQTQKNRWSGSGCTGLMNLA